MSKKHNAHDSGYKKLFSNHEMVRQLLQVLSMKSGSTTSSTAPLKKSIKVLSLTNFQRENLI